METFELGLAHCAKIGILEIWMVPVHIVGVTLRAVVEIGQTALMKTFLSNVHSLLLFEYK
jgi:hypothetical protein